MMNHRLRTGHKRKLGLVVLAVIGLVFLLVWLVQWLWNMLLPDIVGVKPISYWQSFGILLLSKILFGGFRFHKPNSNFKERMQHKMNHFSDDDKERFREEWKKRFGDRCQF